MIDSHYYHVDWVKLELLAFGKAWSEIGRQASTLDGGTSLLSGTSDISKFTAAVEAAWQGRLVPIIGASEPIKDLAKARPHENIHPPEGTVLGFLTSGTSVREPKVIWKSWSQLDSEARTLVQFFGVKTGDQFLSLVPPAHIFGFLYSLLVPAVASAECTSRTNWDSATTFFFPPTGDFRFMVIVPALWNSVRHWLGSLNVQRPLLNIITSGAPFGSRRRSEAGDLQALLRIFDVLGSTETGGLGVSGLPNAEVEASTEFMLLPGVRLLPPETADGGWRVVSPFTDNQAVLVSDRFEWGGSPGIVRHLGRSDRVIKLGGKRVDLSEIETSLAACGLSSPFGIVFVADPETSKSGAIVCVTDCEPGVMAPILSEYRLRFPALPLISQVVHTATLPRSAAGKITQKDLEHIVALHFEGRNTLKINTEYLRKSE